MPDMKMVINERRKIVIALALNVCLSYELSSSKIIRIERCDHVFRALVVSSRGLSIIFHTSLSSVAYDSMEFHLTRPCKGNVEHVKEIPSLFLSACGKCRMPRVLCACRAAPWMRHEIFRHIYVFLSGRTRLIRHCIYEFLSPMKNPRRKTAPIRIIRSWNINKSTKLVAHSHRAFNIRYMLTLRRQKRQRGIYLNI